MNLLREIFQLCRGWQAVLALVLSTTFCVVGNAVEIEPADYEGRAQYKITSQSATYFYDIAGGGFSRLIDRDGRDWISFHKDPFNQVPASAAAGFRGIPNLVFGGDNPDAGVGHAGFDKCESTIVAPDRIQTRSKSRRWEWTWQFFEDHATLTLERVSDEHPFWFLYEGPIAGQWSPVTHYWGTNESGPHHSLPTSAAPELGHWQSVYFGDQSIDRALVVTQEFNDVNADTLWYMPSSPGGLDADDGMVVFGFGRQRGSKPVLRETGLRFAVGFFEHKIESQQDHSNAIKESLSWLEPHTDGALAIESRPIDAECQALLDGMKASNAPGWEQMPPSEARVQFASLTSLFGTGPTEVKSEELLLDGRIPARLYQPPTNNSAPLPVVMFFHGGGWVLGDLDTHDALCRKLSMQAGCSVVSVAYRPAPEHPFPAAMDDCYDATAFVSEHARQYGIDATRLVVMGDSSGGNLAAAVALKANRVRSPAILGQILLYPALDATSQSTSFYTFRDGFGLSATSMKWFWQQYSGEAPVTELLSPSSARSLAGLPQTMIITAQYDILRDEAEQYADRLKQSGVDAQLHRYGGVIHGFVHFAGALSRGDVALSDAANTLQQWFELDSK